ncbi:hypothetical protein Q5P01_000621, partial [Channa striata]
MTLPKGSCLCPICQKCYVAMSKHLSRSHGVVNEEERKILLNLATKRVNIRKEPCPVPGCVYVSSRLDRHIMSHTECTEHQREVYLDDVRRKKSIALLAALRSTAPTPPVASTLDLAEEEGDAVVSDSEENLLCDNVQCLQRLEAWKKKAKSLEDKVESLERELLQVRQKTQRQGKKIRRLSKGVGKVTSYLKTYEKFHAGSCPTPKHRENAFSKESLQKCQVLAKRKIPELLENLKVDFTVSDRNLFYGYITAFLSSIYGHRTGVYGNMTVDEVEGASREGNPPTGYVIHIKEHKTSKDFGAAQIFLHPDEYEWFQTWLEIRQTCFPTGKNVFFTPGRGPPKNLVKYMQAAWADMGLPGKPTFIDLRTAVSAHAKNVHSAEQSREMRSFFEEASTRAAATPTPSPATTSASASASKGRKRAQTEESETSTEEEEVPYQESGDSCLEEEMREVEEEEMEGEGESTPASTAENTPKKSNRQRYAEVVVRLSPLASKLRASKAVRAKA